jgi:hypothetical protein
MDMIVSKFRIGLVIISFVIFSQNLYPQSLNELYDNLKINFDGNGKFEVGGPFAGIELHNSQPLLQRISFFYPTANSIDLSTDYWLRDTSFIASMLLQIDDEFELFDHNKFNVEVTPFNIKFINKNELRRIEISYRFAKHKPAMLMQIEIINLSDSEKYFNLTTHLEASLRTSHTFTLKDKAYTRFYRKGFSIIAEHEDYETQNVRLFSINAGEDPEAYGLTGNLNYVTSNKMEYLKRLRLNNPGDEKDYYGRPAFTYRYDKTLKPDGKMIIKQIIGSSKEGETEELIEYLIDNYEKEIEDYENYVLTKSGKEQIIKTGDDVIDHSVQWARAILETNVHYLDGDFVPMPCPAEYNFYFTHDVLLTNLAVINFDTERVKSDLQFIMKHADNEHTIPHAYYWKDSSYVTEYAGADNWNHFWFLINCASYLRHTNDIEFLSKLYPFIERSLTLVMQNKKEDDLIWAYQPDWWDIGSKFGPRAYMTLLAAKSIRDYIYISSVLNKNLNRLNEWETLSLNMKNSLETRLWNSDNNYLMNYYEKGVPDPHYYTGSLLSAHFGVLSAEKKQKLIETASNVLLDPEIGIYNVYPMDFNELQEYLELLANEAGEPFYYANGGVWPHGSAWYALGLISNSKKKEALDFVKKTMTVKGIMNGPNGQPAMYEYRIAKKDDPAVYGVVDKPQFLWAGGWYLYVLYHLFILNENDWNISLDPFFTDKIKNLEIIFNYFGLKMKINAIDDAEDFSSLKIANEIYPTCVLPAIKPSSSNIELVKSGLPILKSTEAVLTKIDYTEEKKSLTFSLSAFPGHNNRTVISSLLMPNKILIDEKELKDYKVSEKNNYYLITFEFIHPEKETRVEIKF